MTTEKMRVDKWLWAARFFKTRSLACQAIDNGRVTLNDERIKPAREIKAGDQLGIQAGDFEWRIVVKALATQRGPAPVARKLYEEDPASLERRQQQMEQKKLAPDPAAPMKGRPTKRDRRQIHRFIAD